MKSHPSAQVRILRIQPRLPHPGSLKGFLTPSNGLVTKLPDPAFLFVIALGTTWFLSFVLSFVNFTEIDPRSEKQEPIRIVNQLSGESLAGFLSNMVETFIKFPPLGVVLVALLGVGVAEHTGFIQSALKGMLSVTPRFLLTPALILVAIISHSAGDTGYVLIIPLGAVMFAAAGRHPIAGITAAFAGVSGVSARTSSLRASILSFRDSHSLQPESLTQRLMSTRCVTGTSCPCLCCHRRAWMVHHRFHH